MASKPLTAAEELNKQLLEFLERRHPDYNAMLCHWDFLEATYKGGRDWFCGNIFQYMKEGPTEYDDRVKRAYRFNHTRECVDLVQKYIAKSPVVRQKDAPSELQDFWQNATLSGLDINQFMNHAAIQSSTLGMPWIVVDNNRPSEVISIEEAKKSKARVYAYVVKPQDVLNVGWSKDGELNWVLIRETHRDDGDPIFSSGECYYQYRLWERDIWTLFEIVDEPTGKGKATKPVVVVVDSQFHGLGIVPAVPLPHTVGEHLYSAPALINDIAYLDRAVANYLSNLDAIIQDQTFSQLAMPAQAMLPGENGYDKLLEMGTKRIFIYDGEGNARPEFLSPDPKQASMVLAVINKIINEIYHTVGMSGERTKEDNAVGIDNSSGVAKAYDFERMNSLLCSKAAALENAENKINTIVMLWHSKAAPKDELVKYPDTFDVRSLFDEFTLAEKLLEVEAPDIVRREQMRQVVDKLFPRLAADLRKKIETELEGWPVDPVERAGEMAKAQADAQPKPVAGAAPPAKRNASTKSRQGQVTAATKK